MHGWRVDGEEGGVRLGLESRRGEARVKVGGGRVLSFIHTSTL
jgi:hypothetical protein